MSKINSKQIEKDVVALATTLFKDFTKQAVADGKAFLGKIEVQLVTLTQQRARKEISEDEYQDGVSDLKALARMEAIKQQGLAQVAIDSFTNGIVDIVTKAALAAL